jgi:RNA polymerase sigma-70 factor (ECF subfamily)
MAIRSTDSIDGLAFSGEAATAFSATPSEIECEVIDLFDQFRNSLLRYALSFGLSVHDGEEVTQEVFLALFQHLREGKSRHNLRAWIFRVAHNLALKQRQANQRLSGGRDSDEGRAEKQPDLAPSPEERVLSRQRQQHLMAVLQALPERDRCCLGLRLEGLRYREIAPVLGMSLGAVSISLTRSLARLMRANER